MTNIPPGYLRRPWSEARRKAASKAALARTGSKHGHRKLHDVQVPLAYYMAIRHGVRFVRYSSGANLKETQRFIRRLINLFNEYK